MDAQTWLKKALSDLPPGAERRVRQEVLTHLTQAGVGEHADVTALLGRPETVRRSLARTYLSHGDWLALRGHSGWGLTWGLLIFAVLWAIKLQSTGLDVWAYSHGLMLGLGLYVLLGLALLRSSPATRHYLRVRAGFWPLLPAIFGVHPLALASLVGGLLWLAWRWHVEGRRFERTWALQEAGEAPRP